MDQNEILEDHINLSHTDIIRKTINLYMCVGTSVFPPLSSDPNSGSRQCTMSSSWQSSGIGGSICEFEGIQLGNSSDDTMKGIKNKSMNA